MDLRTYVESIHQQLAIAAEAGGDDARALAERLAAPLDSAVHLALQDALAAAVEEITAGSLPARSSCVCVDALDFVVTPAPAGSGEDLPAGDEDEAAVAPLPADADDGAMSRIDLRMPDHLKARIEQAAGSEGLSVNSWLVRAATAAVQRADPNQRRAPRARRAPSTTRAGRAEPPPTTRGISHAYLPDARADLRHGEIEVGDIHIVASERTDTTVEVRPSDAAEQADVAAAEQTRVEFSGGRLVV